MKKLIMKILLGGVGALGLFQVLVAQAANPLSVDIYTDTGDVVFNTDTWTAGSFILSSDSNANVFNTSGISPSPAIFNVLYANDATSYGEFNDPGVNIVVGTDTITISGLYDTAAAIQDVSLVWQVFDGSEQLGENFSGDVTYVTPQNLSPWSLAASALFGLGVWGRSRQRRMNRG